MTAAVAPNLLIGAAEEHVPSGTVAVLVSTTPLWILFGSALTRSGDGMRPRHWVAIPVALSGVAWVCGAGVPLDSLPWCLLPLAAAVSYGISNLVLRRHLAGVSPLLVATAEMMLASAVLVPLAVTNPGRLTWEPVAWAAVATAGIVCSGLGWLANTALVQRAGAGSASIVSYTSVLVSVGLGVVVLHEPLTPRVGLGCLLLLVGVLIFTGVIYGPSPTWKAKKMIELCILGFLAEASQHAYALSRRITALVGHVRPVSDGALTPALRRMEAKGWIAGHVQPQRGARRRIYELTDAGSAELRRRLADPDPRDVTDRVRFFAVLAFLHHLEDPALQRAVLARRLAFIEEPSRSFWVPEEPQLPQEKAVFRAGMGTMARGISRAEHAWLSSTLDALE